MGRWIWLLGLGMGFEIASACPLLFDADVLRALTPALQRHWDRLTTRGGTIVVRLPLGLLGEGLADAQARFRSLGARSGVTMAEGELRHDRAEHDPTVGYYASFVVEGTPQGLVQFVPLAAREGAVVDVSGGAGLE